MHSAHHRLKDLHNVLRNELAIGNGWYWIKSDQGLRSHIERVAVAGERFL
jgi:hypothetical protein